METAQQIIAIDHHLCGQCGGCVPVCGEDAIYLSPVRLEIAGSRCTLCGDCISFCPVRALELADG